MMSMTDPNDSRELANCCPHACDTVVFQQLSTGGYELLSLVPEPKC